MGYLQDIEDRIDKERAIQKQKDAEAAAQAAKKEAEKATKPETTGGLI